MAIEELTVMEEVDSEFAVKGRAIQKGIDKTSKAMLSPTRRVSIL
jgi:hypothetical protein